jgi:hypothetical protein
MRDRCIHGRLFTEPCLECEAAWRDSLIRDLHRDAARLGFWVVPIEGEKGSGLPPDLATMLAAARREGMEAAASWHDEQAAYCAKRAPERRAEGQHTAADLLKALQAEHVNSAAAIRAAAKEDER